MAKVGRVGDRVTDALIFTCCLLIAFIIGLFVYAAARAAPIPIGFSVDTVVTERFCSKLGCCTFHQPGDFGFDTLHDTNYVFALPIDWSKCLVPIDSLPTEMQDNIDCAIFRPIYAPGRTGRGE